eukprot:15445328-Alexandrium_andersonii.AAC.1
MTSLAAAYPEPKWLPTMVFRLTTSASLWRASGFWGGGAMLCVVPASGARVQSDLIGNFTLRARVEHPEDALEGL